MRLWQRMLRSVSPNAMTRRWSSLYWYIKTDWQWLIDLSLILKSHTSQMVVETFHKLLNNTLYLLFCFRHFPQRKHYSGVHKRGKWPKIYFSDNHDLRCLLNPKLQRVKNHPGISYHGDSLVASDSSFWEYRSTQRAQQLQFSLMAHHPHKMKNFQQKPAFLWAQETFSLSR